jgi:hypothetical protein
MEINMTTRQIIAQLLGAGIIIVCILAPHRKTKAKIVLFFFITQFLQLLQFWMLMAYSGVGSSTAACIRSVILLIFALKHKKAPTVVFALLILMHIAAVGLTWQGAISLWLLCPICNIYGQWQDNVKVVRICAILSSIGFTAYSLISGAYVGALNEVMMITSACIALWRFRKPRSVSVM